ncbi:unnamed protein product [Cunninghamella echinulata]
MSILTTSNGNPVEDNETSLTAGEWGPILLEDFHLIDKLAHFDRERIPERVAHAKGTGAHGYFEVTHDITKYTKAKLFSEVGKKTPIFTRFSTVSGELGSADTIRDPRGFAVKFYTEEGNWDMVGINSPVFFIRDPLKFPDLIHSQKRNPITNLKDANMFWDFLSLVPESLHQTTVLFSNRGTPDGFRHMHGFSSHCLSFVNEQGEYYFVKLHFISQQGAKNLKAEKAEELVSKEPDYATKDLYNAIEKGDYPVWELKIQVIEPKDVKSYRWNVFDMTKVLPHKDFPLIPVGKMVLDRNPENFFAEVEQAAFSPSNMVPGIAPSPDRMLQGRLFSYPDTQRYRIGPNFQQLPINQPKSKVRNQQRDGAMTLTTPADNPSEPNYEPNSFNGPKDQGNSVSINESLPIEGNVGRHTYKLTDDDFVQPGDLYRLLSNEEKTDLINNIAGHLSGAKKDIRDRQIQHIKRADPEYGQRVESAIDDILAKK